MMVIQIEGFAEIIAKLDEIQGQIEGRGSKRESGSYAAAQVADHPALSGRLLKSSSHQNKLIESDSMKDNPKTRMECTCKLAPHR